MLTMQNAWDMQHSKSMIAPSFETSSSTRDGQTNVSSLGDNNDNTIGNQVLNFGDFVERSISAPPMNDARESFSNLISGSSIKPHGEKEVRHLSICF